MEIVSGTQYQHSRYGEVTVRRVCREYSLYDVSAEKGRVPGGFLVVIETQSGDRHSEPVTVFLDRVE